MREYKFNQENITKRMSEELIKSEVNLTSEKITSYFRSHTINIKTLHDLVVEIAELSNKNPDVMLFYRGQERAHLAKKYFTLYPSIYRNTKRDLMYKFDMLGTASSLLIDRLKEISLTQEIPGLKELAKIKKLQHAVLQHYEVCDTPYLDVTQSIKVACSFACGDTNEKGYLFVLGLPYLTGRISIDSEDDISNTRLISICTSFAKRPFFQEGYLIGTEFVDKFYDQKNELDFVNRLIAVYEFDNLDSFWFDDRGIGEKRISKDVLYPDIDPMVDICNEIKRSIYYKVASNELIGEFLYKWSKLENSLLSESPYNNTLASIKHLYKTEVISNENMRNIELLRNFRNRLVHNTDSVNSKEISEMIELLDSNTGKIR